jgi:4-amino-4-deoxy-L-arabinose transferase-like glycosyltransferase
MIEDLTKILKKNKNILIIISVALIIFLGIAIRLYKINSIPPGLYGDVAANGIDSLSILDGNFRAQYWRNGGREGMFYYIVAFLMLFTKEYFVMYLATAAIGSTTLIVNWFVIKDWLGKKIALISTFLMSFSFFHIHYSRLGYRTILTPLIVLTVFYFMRKMLEKKDIKYSILAGFFAGLGIYTYLSYRGFLIGAVLSLGYFLFWNRKILKEYTKRILVFFASAIITAIPFILSAIEDPVTAFGRSQSVSAEGSLIENVIKTLKVFGIKGDPEVQYNVPEMPVISLLLTGFLILGLIWLLKKKFKSFEMPFVLLTIGSHLAIVAITDRIPHMLRAVGITAFIFTLVAIGIVWIYKFFENNEELGRYKNYLKYGFAACMILYFITIPISAYNNYFNVWAKTENIDRLEFFTDYIALGHYLEKFSKEELREVRVVANWYVSETETRKDSYVLQTADYILMDDPQIFQVDYLDSMSTDNKGIYILKYDDIRGIEKFNELFPEAGQTDAIYSEKDPEFLLFRVYDLR